MGRVVHFDIAADDTDRAIAFYREAFGCKIGNAGGPFEYWLIETGKEGLPGIDGELARREADWQRITMFVEVESAEESARRIVAAGGSIVQPRMAIAGVGTIVACKDTEDNIFAVIEPMAATGAETKVRARRSA